MTDLNVNENTISRYPTHFLRAVELITQARDSYGVPSENWCYPTRHSLGTSKDLYYAEIWEDGMDWQTSLWVIETFSLDNPVCRPFIVFEDQLNQKKFNRCNFDELVHASLYERRDRLWIKKDEDRFNDSIWSYFKRVNPIEIHNEKAPDLLKFEVELLSLTKLKLPHL